MFTYTNRTPTSLSVNMSLYHNPHFSIFVGIRYIIFENRSLLCVSSVGVKLMFIALHRGSKLQTAFI